MSSSEIRRPPEANVASTAWRWAGVAIALVAFVLVPFFLLGGRVERAAAEALNGAERAPALLLGSALLIADVVLPVPSSVVMTSMSALAGPAAAWLASALGLCIGACIGYAIGFLMAADGVHRFVGPAARGALTRLLQRHGAWALVLCRPIPVLAECSCIVAGMGGMALRRFVPATLLASAIVPLPYVCVGGLATDNGAFLLAFAISMGGSGLLWWLGQRVVKRKERR